MNVDTKSHLGLPTAHSLFRSCLDNDLLFANGLLCSYDLGTRQRPTVPIPKSPNNLDNPAYARNTSASIARSRNSHYTNSSGGAELAALKDLDEEISHVSPGSETESAEDFPVALQPTSAASNHRSIERNDNGSVMGASGASGGLQSSPSHRGDTRQRCLRKVSINKWFVFFPAETFSIVCFKHFQKCTKVAVHCTRSVFNLLILSPVAQVESCYNINFKKQLFCLPHHTKQACSAPNG